MPVDATAPFPVQVTASAAPVGRLGCDISAGMQAPFADDWRIATDEPKVQGGAGEAPPPLVLLAAALASCLSVQLRSFARKSKADLPAAAVAAEIEWLGHPEPTGYRAEGQVVKATMTLDTEEPPEVWAGLARRAIGGCFVEALLSRDLEVRHRLVTRSGEMSL